MPFSNNSYTQGDPKVKHFLEFPKEWDSSMKDRKKKTREQILQLYV